MYEVNAIHVGPRPLAALELIVQLGLYPLVFTSPPRFKEPTPDSQPVLQVARWIKALADPIPGSPAALLHPTLAHACRRGSRHLFLAAALAPYQDKFVPVKKRTVWLGELVISESIKVSII